MRSCEWNLAPPLSVRTTFGTRSAEIPIERTECYLEMLEIYLAQVLSAPEAVLHPQERQPRRHVSKDSGNQVMRPVQIDT